MRGVLLAISLAVAAPFATAAITDGTSSFDFTQASLGGAGTDGQSNLIHNAQDQAFQIWWWIRGPGDAAELAFPTVTSEVEAGNVNTLTWGSLGTAAGPVAATSVFTLTSSGNVTNLSIELTLDYTGTDPVTYDVFLYADLDLNGTAGSDSGTGDGNGVIVTEGANAFLLTLAGANAFQVSSFASLRTSLNDGSVTNLNNSGLPFGPGDFTVAFQKAVTFGGAGKGTVSANIGVGAQEDILVPEPGTWLLTGLGVLALGFARRRNQR